MAGNPPQLLGVTTLEFAIVRLQARNAAHQLGHCAGQHDRA
jgi:hypothetical protein